MARKISDGWHNIAGYSVWVEDGLIRRGTLGEGVTYRPAWPYRWSKECRAWVKEVLTPDAFRAGVRRGTIKMT